MSNSIVTGSIGAIAERDGMGIAEAFLSADVIVLVDTSGSMIERDARGGRRRYDVACDELQQLQARLPGKIAVVSFSDTSMFCPTGIPVFLKAGTNLTGALQFVKPADGTVQFIVISDGQPDNESSALSEAKKFESKIDTIYIGPESGFFGADFLRRLAAASGGTCVVAEYAAQLAEKVETLLIGGAK